MKSIAERRHLNKENLFKDFFGEEVLPFFSGSLVTLFDKTSELIKVPFRLAQAGLNKNFFNQFVEEYETLRRNGVFKDKFSRIDQTNLVELLKYFDEEIADEEKFKALKSIFFYSINKNTTEQDEIEAYEMIRLCKKLTSGEILVLRTFYAFSKGENPPKVRLEAKGYNYANWVEFAAQYQGHNLSELVRNNAVKLLENNILNSDLLNEPFQSFGSPITKLGFKLCEFITKYP